MFRRHRRWTTSYSPYPRLFPAACLLGYRCRVLVHMLPGLVLRHHQPPATDACRETSCHAFLCDVPLWHVTLFIGFLFMLAPPLLEFTGRLSHVPSRPHRPLFETVAALFIVLLSCVSASLPRYEHKVYPVPLGLGAGGRKPWMLCARLRHPRPPAGLSRSRR